MEDDRVARDDKSTHETTHSVPSRYGGKHWGSVEQEKQTDVQNVKVASGEQGRPEGCPSRRGQNPEPKQWSSSLVKINHLR